MFDRRRKPDTIEQLIQQLRVLAEKQLDEAQQATAEFDEIKKEGYDCGEGE
jgi:hypothetical protein